MTTKATDIWGGSKFQAVIARRITAWRALFRTLEEVCSWGCRYQVTYDSVPSVMVILFFYFKFYLSGTKQRTLLHKVYMWYRRFLANWLICNPSPWSGLSKTKQNKTETRNMSRSKTNLKVVYVCRQLSIHREDLTKHPCIDWVFIHLTIHIIR